MTLSDQGLRMISVSSRFRRCKKTALNPRATWLRRIYTAIAAVAGSDISFHQEFTWVETE
jgi:hypothetical protein